MTDFKDPDKIGQLETWLECPACDFRGVVYYNTQPPRYCSDACRQRAYRLRKAKHQMRHSPSVTYLLGEFQDQGFRGELLGMLEWILKTWGADAANAAAELAVCTAKEIRQLLAKRRGLS